jgi:hypothetical protein
MRLANEILTKLINHYSIIISQFSSGAATRRCTTAPSKGLEGGE